MKVILCFVYVILLIPLKLKHSIVFSVHIILSGTANVWMFLFIPMKFEMRCDACDHWEIASSGHRFILLLATQPLYIKFCMPGYLRLNFQPNCSNIFCTCVFESTVLLLTGTRGQLCELFLLYKQDHSSFLSWVSL